NTVFVIDHVGAVEDLLNVLSFVGIPDITKRSVLGSHDKMIPFPSLRTNESKTTDDGPEHPYSNASPVHPPAGFNGEHHRNGRHDEDEGHQTYICKRDMLLNKREMRKNVFRLR